MPAHAPRMTEAVDRVGMDVVQEFLGHTKLVMTRWYAKMNTDRLKLALRRTKNGAGWRRYA
jgi:site-specific recombinase XerD